MENFLELNTYDLEQIEGGNGWKKVLTGVGAVASGIAAASTLPVIGPAAAIGISASIIGGQILGATGLAEALS